ncbi:peroxiredoxin [Rasiella sp. SM2506]|uniref:peroxiredoxin n=1 Tax=Rasiella sp. SM2506 TaxID=3423914 RepID=UPI003D7AB1D6
MNKGDTLPDFTLNDQNGEPYASELVKGKQPVVIYFYPKNFTPGCTKEACSFRDAYEDFKDLGAEVIGISADTDVSHQKFAKRYRLPFVLLADTKKKVRKLFNVQSTMLGLLPGRETFVFDASGILVYKFESMGATKHIEKSLQYLQKNSDG